jgi:hypothetical protein
MKALGRLVASSDLLMAGVNVKVVSERFGHASVSFPLDTYGHIMPGQQARPGAVVVAGSPLTPAVCEVVDLVDKPVGTVVHLRVLPGTIDQYRRLLSRVGA